MNWKFLLALIALYLCGAISGTYVGWQAGMHHKCADSNDEAS